MPKPSLRDAIVDAAVAEFHRHGYSGAGVAGIAAAAGAPKGSFYNHFRSKADLAVAAADRFVAGNRAEMLDDPAVPRALDRVTGHFAFLGSRLESTGVEHGCLLGNLAADTAVDEPVVAVHLDGVFGGWAARLTDLVRTAQAEGDVDEALDPALTADLLVAMWEGVALRAKVHGDGTAARRQLDEGVRRLLGVR